MARGFADQGWHVVIHYNSSGDAAEQLAADLPSAETTGCDLADSDAAVAMIDNLADRLTDWRCVVNSASIFGLDDAEGIDPDLFTKAMRVNALSPARMARSFLENARSAGPRCVIDILDMKVANLNPDFFSYTMAKSALAASVRMLAKHDFGDDARVYGLAPGAILASHDQSEEETEISHRLNLLERKTHPQEIVDAALYLSTGTLCSGETLFVDSGQHLLDQDRDVIFLAREMMARGEAQA